MDGGLHGRGWCKGFIYVWDKRFLILNSGWDCSGYSAAYDCSSGADFWQDGASSWWGILDQMRAEKFSLVKQGRVKAGHIDVLQMEYILDVMDQVCIQANLKLLIVLFRCSCTGLGLWNIIHPCAWAGVHTHSVYRWFCAYLQGCDIKNGKLGHKGLEIGLEYFTSHMVG